MLAGSATAVSKQRRAGGYTLVEVGLVVLLLGMVAVMVAEFYVSQLDMDRDGRRVTGTVRDVRLLVDASILWAETYGRWPNDANVIGLEPLIAAGFLTEATRPRNRYVECADCEDYALLGWDRDVIGADGKGDYTSLASDAEDLVVRLQVWRRSDAELIASQLPQGKAVETDTGVFEVEARAFDLGIRTGDFVRLLNENRPVVFATYNLAPNVQGGDLQRIGRITGGKQKPPCGPNQNPFLDGCQSTTSQYVTDGPALVFHERPCERINEDGLDETTDPERFGCRVECSTLKQEGDTCHAPPLTDQPTILFREGVVDAPMCDYKADPNCRPFELGVIAADGQGGTKRIAGPAVVLHGTDETARERPYGPVVHLLSKGAGGYAKVRIVGGLELEREPGRDGAPRPGQPPGGELLYTFPSARDVVTQSELDWIQCCLDNLSFNSSTSSVSCARPNVAQCVSAQEVRRQLASAGP